MGCPSGSPCQEPVNCNIGNNFYLAIDIQSDTSANGRPEDI